MQKKIKGLVFVLIAVLVISIVLFKFVSNDTAATVNIEKPKMTATMPMVGNMAASHSFSSGPIDAKVTVVEYFDPECESCAAVAPYIEKEMEYYKGKVRWVFRYMTYHKNSATAVKVLEAARKQNLFLEVQHILFQSQKVWGEKQEPTESEILKVVSQVPKINMAKIKSDMNDPATAEIIAKDATEGAQGGVTGTPTFFVNGMILDQLDLDLLIKKINEGL
ncbi:MAG: thioredoxin domain-containing protein [Bdellovibrio sp.]|nr:thioredoxin domain-containing protein [Bdellovibrio sp.]